MTRRYLLQRTPLADTLKRGVEPVWETVGRRYAEKSIRRHFWHLVNQPMHDTLYIYRMFDTKTNEVFS